MRQDFVLDLDQADGVLGQFLGRCRDRGNLFSLVVDFVVGRAPDQLPQARLSPRAVSGPR